MKKIFTVFSTHLIAGLLFCNLFAQTNNQPVASAFKSLQLSNNIASIDNTDKPATALTNVNAKVLRSFIESFSTADNPNWFAADKNYLAKFNLDERNGRAVFNKNGYMFYSICYGEEKHLPASARKLIKSNYVDYEIGVVREVYTLNQKLWVVNIEDSTDIIIVRVMNDALEELEHYKKSK